MATSNQPVPETPLQANTDQVAEASAVPVTATPKESNEVFLGGVVVAILCLLLVILAGTFGFFGYRLWKTAQVEQATPSIQELGEKPVVKEMTPQPTEPTPTPTPAPAPQTSPTPAVEDLAKVEVKVLNGGGARGSASTLTDLLKKEGYTKATFGNTVKDYTGTTIYYTAASQKEAEAVKTIVVKTYPAVTLTAAQAGDKDATAAAVVVVLGK